MIYPHLSHGRFPFCHTFVWHSLLLQELSREAGEQLAGEQHTGGPGLLAAALPSPRQSLA